MFTSMLERLPKDLVFFGCIEILYMCHLHKEAAQTLQRLHAMLFLQVADRFHEFVALQRTCLIETPS